MPLSSFTTSVVWLFVAQAYMCGKARRNPLTYLIGAKIIKLQFHTCLVANPRAPFLKHRACSSASRPRSSDIHACRWPAEIPNWHKRELFYTAGESSWLCRSVIIGSQGIRGKKVSWFCPNVHYTMYSLYIKVERGSIARLNCHFASLYECETHQRCGLSRWRVQ